MEDVLVAEGQRLLALLDATSAKPRTAIWVTDLDGKLRLWVVPSERVTVAQFNVVLADTIASHSDEFQAIEVQSIATRSADDPIIQRFKVAVRAEGMSSIRLSGCTFNDVVIPDCIILRSQF